MKCNITFLFIWGLVDLTLAMGFAVVVVLQAMYLPRPLGQCQSLEQLKPDGGKGKSYLDFLGQLEFGWFDQNRKQLGCDGRRVTRRALQAEKAQMELEKKGQAQAAADIELGLQKHSEGTVKISSAEVYLSRMLGRAVRAAALGAMGAEMVRKLTCSSGSKGQCWSCGEQICTILHRDIEVAFHVKCQPHCSSCYRRKLCCNRPKRLNSNVDNNWWWVSTPNLCSCDKQRFGLGGTYELENDQMALRERRQARGLAMDDDPDGAATMFESSVWRCLECGTCMMKKDVERIVGQSFMSSAASREVFVHIQKCDGALHLIPLLYALGPLLGGCGAKEEVKALSGS
ncbi:hypothetical protein BDZ91DRAFT_767269 [Kalaharituber pfeilii]|nr:hypothetical protein BDZ91DRAFT_767269 [Kalaharituber pfeilii]